MGAAPSKFGSGCCCGGQRNSSGLFCNAGRGWREYCSRPVEYGSCLKVGEMIEVFVEHPFVAVDSKGLNSLTSFFIFGELMIKFVSGVRSSEASSRCGCRVPRESLLKTPIKQRIR